jgi:hypothetical protein
MRGDLIAGLLGLLAGSAVVAGALRLGAGTLTRPEPGFFPLLGGVTLGALSGLLLVQARLGRSTGTAPLGATGRQLLLLGGMALFTVTLEPLGDLLATAVLAGLSLRAFGVTSWLVVGASSAAVAAATHLVLVRGLGVDLPAGLLARLG